MNIDELEAAIYQSFRHLATFPDVKAGDVKRWFGWLKDNLGPEASSMKKGERDAWEFDATGRWCEACSADYTSRSGYGFRFRELSDAVLFKLNCG